MYDATNAGIVAALGFLEKPRSSTEDGESHPLNNLFRPLTRAGRFARRSAPRASELLNNKLQRPTHTCAHGLLNQTRGHSFVPFAAKTALELRRRILIVVGLESGSLRSLDFYRRVSRALAGRRGHVFC